MVHLRPRRVGDALSQHVIDGHVNAVERRRPRSHRGLFHLALEDEVVEIPALRTAFGVGEPAGVLEHVGENKERSRPGLLPESQAGFLNGLDQKGVRHGYHERSLRQTGDRRVHFAAQRAKAGGVFGRLRGELRRKVVAVPGLAHILGAAHRQDLVRVGLAEAAHEQSRRGGVRRQGEHAQLGVAARPESDVAQRVHGERSRLAAERLAQVQQQHGLRALDFTERAQIGVQRNGRLLRLGDEQGCGTSQQHHRRHDDQHQLAPTSRRLWRTMDSHLLPHFLPSLPPLAVCHPSSSVQ